MSNESHIMLIRPLQLSELLENIVLVNTACDFLLILILKGNEMYLVFQTQTCFMLEVCFYSFAMKLRLMKLMEQYSLLCFICLVFFLVFIINWLRHLALLY